MRWREEKASDEDGEEGPSLVPSFHTSIRPEEDDSPRLMLTGTPRESLRFPGPFERHGEERKRER